MKPHLYKVKYILLEEDRQILFDPSDTKIGECIEFASRKNYFSDLVSILLKPISQTHFSNQKPKTKNQGVGNRIFSYPKNPSNQ